MAWAPVCCLLVVTCSVGVRASSQDETEILQELDTVLNQIAEVLQNRGDDSVIHDEERDKRYHGRGCPRSNQVQCPGSRACVLKSQFCDGRKDCPRGMDERKTKCRRRPKSMISGEKRGLVKEDKVLLTNEDTKSDCGYGEVPCGGSRGKCISRDFLCDGYVDCYEDSWDESSTICGKSVSCAKGMIKCNNTGSCIYEEDLCDNIPNCEDHEDESVYNCGIQHCTSGTTKCPSSNLCLDNEYWCDDYKDCVNGEDEDISYCQYVPCDGLRCSDGTCVPGSAYCDGFADCKDGADEDIDRCGPVKCPGDALRCKTMNSCVSVAMLCDGIKDCPDGEDESEEDCKQLTKGPAESSDLIRTLSKKDNEDTTKRRLAKLLEMLVKN